MPGPRGCFGSRVSEHVGGPQLPARGQRQLSGGGKFAFSFGAVALIWGHLPISENIFGCYILGWEGRY